ncbi:carbon-nitrogen hydrolase family protein [Methanosphaera sp.]|uniref:carbon-nitrogen hydrolase family protein n=1 Tax=Methanosphaera sp. TaxID=2666342 RepID=UPI0026E05CF4|nr:carbon-nitrogen hydrolase family protein [Methanosphaera sp.]MDO5821822.1 carbon-nitrogen hydrolase family protein [Methanosphaera sp.]
MKDFKIATCQMNVVDNKDTNIEHAIQLIKKASSNGAKLITLPEMFNTPYDNSKFIEYCEEETTSKTLNSMQDIAREENIYLQSGSIPEKESNHLYNTAYLINPKGKIIGKHRKMHMFDIDTDNMKFTESDTLTPGDSVTTIKTPLANISIAICYDIRFPELWTLMNKNNSDIILLPGAFNKTTGPLHWETLIKARAIDNQCYVVATSPSQIENPYYVAWGHSMIVNPWGKIIAKAHENEEILYANITQSSLSSVRNQIPVRTNRRNDIYDTILK